MVPDRDPVDEIGEIFELRAELIVFSEFLALGFALADHQLIGQGNAVVEGGRKPQTHARPDQ